MNDDAEKILMAIVIIAGLIMASQNKDKTELLKMIDYINNKGYFGKKYSKTELKHLIRESKSVDINELSEQQLKKANEILFTKCGLTFEECKILTQKDIQMDLIDMINQMDGADKKNKMLKKIDEHHIKIKGIDISSSEEKVIHAIQTLLTHRNYILDNGILEFTPAEFLEEYGVKKHKHKDGKYKYSGRGRSLAFDSLNSLMEKNFAIFYEYKTYNSKGEERFEVIKEISPILIGAEYFGDLTLEEKEMLYNNIETENIRKKIKKIAIRPHRVLTDNIDTHFTFKPKNYIAEIENYTKKPITKYMKNFINLLFDYVAKNIKSKKMRSNFDWTFERNYITIARSIWMLSDIDKRNWKRIRNRLNDYYKTLSEIGYIKDYKVDVKGKTKLLDKLTLNPDKFYRPD
jgi:hypothetical protein